MCGIGGVLRLGDDPIKPEQIKTLLIGLQPRGGDATGIALLNGNNIAVHKSDDIAWRYCSNKNFADFLTENLNPNTDCVIVHTRAATKGLPHINANNHPLESATTAIVHNGVIRNDDELFKDLQMERLAETDSDVIRAIVDKENGITPSAIRTLNQMVGSCAVAGFSTKSPGKLLLARSGSPLIMGYTGTQLIWSSTKDPIHKAARVWQKHRGMWFQATKPNLLFNPFSQECAYIIDIERMRREQDYTPFEAEFSTCKQYVAPVYHVHDNHADKQRRFAEQRRQEQSRAQAEDTEGSHGTTKLEQAMREQEERSKRVLATHKVVPISTYTDGNVSRCDKHRVTFSKTAECPLCVSIAKNQADKKKYAKATPDRLNKLRKGEKIACPNPDCNMVFTIGPEAEGKSIYELECTKCSWSMADLSDDSVSAIMN